MQQGLDDDLYHRVEEYRDIGAFSEAEKLAAETAERFCWSHEETIRDDAYWQRMKANFTDQQILELLTLIGFCVGIGRTLAMLDIADDCPVNRTADPDQDPTHYAHG